MFNFEEYDKKVDEIVRENSESLAGSIKKNKHISREEKIAEFDAHVIKENDYEQIDRRIYAIEHRFVRDGVVDWNGCKINEEWEQYKEKVGYYKRHPEEEEYSRAFTRKFIKAQEQSDDSNSIHS